MVSGLAEGWRTLFNGKDLAGWKANVYPDSWSVIDGAIRARAGKEAPTECWSRGALAAMIEENAARSTSSGSRAKSRDKGGAYFSRFDNPLTKEKDKEERERSARRL